MKCPICHREVPVQSVYCPFCRASLAPRHSQQPYRQSAARPQQQPYRQSAARPQQNPYPPKSTGMRNNDYLPQAPYPNAQGTGHMQAAKTGVITIKKPIFIISCSVIGVIILALIAALVFTNISFGSSSTKNSIVGAWKNAEGEVCFEFFEDGTCTNFACSYYEATENGVLRTFDVYHYPKHKMYYKVDGNKLYLGENKMQLDENIENNKYYTRA